VLTAAGAVTVRAPRVNDKRVDPETGERQRFSSAILPAWARKSPEMTEVLPLLYLHGLSGGDFAPALEQFLGTAAGLSASAIARLTSQWQDEARAFAERDLFGVDYVYLRVDGIHLKVRLDQEKLCLLVMIGVRADGRKELVALTDGYRESTESWADLLRGCRRRGMRAPVLAVGDGALGFWAALREVFPDTREQRCWFHKQANVLAALPKSAHPGALVAMREIFNAEGHRPGAGRDQGIRGRLRREVSESGREDCRRCRRVAGVLPVSGRALDTPENDKPNRYLECSVDRLRCPTRDVEVRGSALWTWLSAVVQKAGLREAECSLCGWFRRSRRVSRGPFLVTTIDRSNRWSGIWPI
jgi:putative transposase